MDLNRAIKLRFQENNMLKSKGMDIDSLIEQRKKEEIQNQTLFDNFIRNIDKNDEYEEEIDN